jgi:hypothetical protein
VLRAIPVTLSQANAIVARLHRHHPPAVGHKFSIGAWAAADELPEGHEGPTRPARLSGVAIVGHPIARMLDQRRIVEVARVCTDGTGMACSFLYGACARADQALGYFAIITYTLDEESGASLRGAGWWGEPVPELTKTWHTPSDPRRTGGIGKPKWRWVRFLSEWPEELPVSSSETQGAAQEDLFRTTRSTYEGGAGNDV